MDEYSNERSLPLELPQQDDVYVFVKFLGQGSFGKVNLYRNSTDNTLVVWKEINMKRLDTKSRNEAFAEVEILSMLDHPNIITYYKHFIGDDTLYIELQYAKAGTLTSLIKQQQMRQQHFDQEVVLWYLYQLCNAVDYIHDIGIMHRDIKALNIFFMHSGLLKLGDFGIAKSLDKEGLLETQVGTPFYMSPELIEGKKYSTKSDIWAVGVVAYEMLTLDRVFDATNQLKLAIKILSCDVANITIEQYSQELRSLVMKILSKDSSQRPSAREILADPVFKSKSLEFQNRIEDLNNANASKRARNPPPTFASDAESSADVLKRRNSNSSSLLNTCFAISLQYPIIASKLSELYVWGGGKILPQQIEFFKKEHAPLHIALGLSHYAVLTIEKELYTWSASHASTGGSLTSIGKLGHGKSAGFTRKPKRVDAFTAVEQVSCGEEMTACIGDDGNVYVFGTNFSGCLGLGARRGAAATTLRTATATPAATGGDSGNDDDDDNALDDEASGCEIYTIYTPTLVPYFKENRIAIRQLACGDFHVIALSESNQIYTWGCGEYGRLGHGDEDDRNEPTEVHFGFKYTFSGVFAGADTSFVLTKEGRVMAFGNNDHNKLCLNILPVGFKRSVQVHKCVQEGVQVVQQLTPKFVKQLSPYRICKVCPGTNHTAVIDEFGRLFTFGSNKFGQLGCGDCKPRASIHLVSATLSGHHVTNAALGDTFTICSTSENHIFSWGNKKEGRLGLDIQFDENASICIPKPIFGTLHLVSEICAKHWHSVIIAEQILAAKPMRSVSYADYMRISTSSSNVSSLQAAPSSGQESDSDDALAAIESDQAVESKLPTNDNKNNSNNNNNNNHQQGSFFLENDNNETSDVPEWLKKDLEEAAFIPISALEKSFAKEQIKDSDIIEKQIRALEIQEQVAFENLDEALIFIKQLRDENQELKERNKQLSEEIQRLKQVQV